MFLSKQGAAIAALALSATMALATAAAALCHDGVEAPLPSTVTFDAGAVVEILSLDAEGLRYRVTDPKRPAPSEVVIRAGIFMQQVTAEGQITRFDWTSALPTLDALAVGASFEATAQWSSPGQPNAEFGTKAQVTGEEVVTLDGCDYPVLVIEVQNFWNGRAASKVTKYLHLPSQIPLKNIVRQGDKVTENTVVALD